MDYPKFSEFEYKGYKVTIFYDNNPTNPRKFCDNFGTMKCFHSRYNLGDFDGSNSNQTVEEFLIEVVSVYENEDRIDEDYTNLPSKEFRNKYIEKFEKYYIVLPLYLYDHSGITMNTTGFNCYWDSGRIGWIYVSKVDVRKKFKKERISKKLREKVKEILRDEVKIYNYYITGCVFGYEIERYGDFHSCWGFFCDPEENLIPEVKSLIDHLHKKEIEENEISYKKEIGDEIYFENYVS